ncbi:V-type ATP synthase subunit B [Nocardia nova]|uniref:V-type ATP synthase subunit B n=1 Tax=Nocardia nova TaxID=37330 RepID=UPI0021576C1D|nr:V-type ATP synthase subunit B [Nocardia nova]
MTAAGDQPTVTPMRSGRTSPRTWVEYTRVREMRGPLLVVSGLEGVGWDEFVRVRLGDGEVRHGVVLDVAQDIAVVEMLEGTAGMDPASVRAEFTGAPYEIPVGPQWLGRVCNGRGAPLDGGPPVTGAQMPVAGAPLNPVRREAPVEPVLTGVSVIDALTTLVRGQKLPIFSPPGLPHLRLACQIAAHSGTGGESFCVVVATMGVTHADAAFVRDALAERRAARQLVLLLNLADDPVVERILTPRIALTIAEQLAFGESGGRHVLVVLADMTNYCEALREVSSARGEIPSRRAYPGYLYSDLASMYERCGRIRGELGSVTLVPVVTMPGGDITHPVPDLTGYITEGQIVLSATEHARGVYPPVDALASLSRLMRHGVGTGHTRADHLPVAAQIFAALARARQVRELTELIGADALTAADHAYLDFDEGFRRGLVAQGGAESRTLDDTLERAWRILLELPSAALTMLPEDLLASHGVG